MNQIKFLKIQRPGICFHPLNIFLNTVQIPVRPLLKDGGKNALPLSGFNYALPTPDIDINKATQVSVSCLTTFTSLFTFSPILFPIPFEFF